MPWQAQARRAAADRTKGRKREFRLTARYRTPAPSGQSASHTSIVVCFPPISRYRLAILARHTEVVRLLLVHNADVDVRDGDGDTPLHCAAFGGQLEVARILLLELNVEVSDRATQRHPPCIPDDTTDDAAAGVTQEALAKTTTTASATTTMVRAGASQAYAPPMTSQRQRGVGSNRATQRHLCIPDDDNDDVWGKVPLPMCATGP
jgi:hypothetical protein